MRNFVVTGANKGVGLAIVGSILEQINQSFVFLCSRSIERGNDAVKTLKADVQDRVKVVKLDVSSSDSIVSAVSDIEGFLVEKEKKVAIEGLINNAGILGLPLKTALDVNVRAVREVTTAFVPHIQKGGKVINIGSGSAPNFVEQCNERGIAFFINPSVTWDEMEKLMTAVEGDFDNNTGICNALVDFGLKVECGDELSAYGLSKALLHSLTMIQARENPELEINACTPGFIATDMTMGTFAKTKDDAKNMGMKKPDEGTLSTMYLLTRDRTEKNGFYYGSDGKRSPLHKYRAPGTEEYKGE